MTSTPLILIIVSRERIGLYDLMRRSNVGRFEIRLDQRLGDRRTRSDRVGHERRHGERRVRDVTEELVRVGWVLVQAADRAR